MIGWEPDTRAGWRSVGHKWHYFGGDGSLCGHWAQPRTPNGQPSRKPIKAELEAHDRELACAICTAVRAEQVG
jgi:hypothetical protein